MTSLLDLNQPVVLDLGSGLTKAGFAGSAEPTALIGTLVGRPKHPQVMPLTSASIQPSSSVSAISSTAPLSGSPTTSRSKYLSESAGNRNLLVGDELRTLSGIVRLSSPFARGAVVDWGDAEEIWRHVLYDLLKLGNGEHPMLITENPLNPRKNRERLAEFFFETVQAPSLYVSIPAVLALYASGRTTGLALDIGDTVCSALPVAEGHCDVNAIRRLDIGGRDVTERLVTLMRKAGHSLFASSSERQAVRRIKERLGYVAVRPREEENRFEAEGEFAEFELPDGEVIRVGAERFRAPEILFTPAIVAREFGGVQFCVKEAIGAVDLELRRRLYGTILLAVCCINGFLTLVRRLTRRRGQRRIEYGCRKRLLTYHFLCNVWAQYIIFVSYPLNREAAQSSEALGNDYWRRSRRWHPETRKSAFMLHPTACSVLTQVVLFWHLYPQPSAPWP